MLVVALLGSAACGRSCTSSPSRPSSPSPPPPLTVLVVVDQLRADELQTYAPLFRHGLRRLLDEGRVYTDARLGYARTETAAGHATLATGVQPREHGVVDKVIYDRERGQRLYVCEFGTPPCPPDVLKVPTLGDRLRDLHPEGQVVALARKDRSAMLLGGRNPTLVAWMQGSPSQLVGRWNGTTVLPGWLQLYFEQVAGPDRIARQWELPLLPPPFSERPDAGPGELDLGFGTVFPHRLPDAPKRLYHVWYHTPDADRAVIELALRVVQRLGLGQNATPDLLALSLGGFDGLGHLYGPDSLERAAAFVELDRQIGDLLEGLEKEVGRRPLVALSSDHGVDSNPKIHQAKGRAAGVVDSQTLLKAMGADPEDVLAFPFVTLADPRPERVAQVVAALEALPVVYRAWPVNAVHKDPDPVAALVAANIHPGRSGDVAVVLEPHFAPKVEQFGDGGTHHGSPWDYDRHVPIILWGEGVRAVSVRATVDVIDLGRTLADRWNVAPYPGQGRSLP